MVNNALSAESGGASGGSINVITRSGVNLMHGDAFIFAQDSAFNAREPFETQLGKPSFRRFRAGAACGSAFSLTEIFSCDQGSYSAIVGWSLLTVPPTIYSASYGDHDSYSELPDGSGGRVPTQAPVSTSTTE